jgi:alkylation response protein AidB-like acyl-CoA dehydrogenase
MRSGVEQHVVSMLAAPCWQQMRARMREQGTCSMRLPFEQCAATSSLPCTLVSTHGVSTSVAVAVLRAGVLTRRFVLSCAGGTVLKLGTARHHQGLLRGIDNVDDIGCFALTELGFGESVCVRGTVSLFVVQ